MITVFNFTDYKKYLSEKLAEIGKTERGLKQKVADHIGCQASYLSQVLNGKPDFTLDQAFKLNQVLHHDKVEAKYFILLVELSRAATKELKTFFLDQIKELQQMRFDLKKRLRDTDHISNEDANKYYSTWFYSAIHIALAIPEYQNSKALSQKLHLPEDIVVEVIRFLESCGLIENIKGQYQFTKKRIHLDRNSDFVHRSHINWRSQSLQSVEKNLKSDLHFSTVFAVSKDDFENIKEVFIQAIESARKIMPPSPSEEICAITLDVFKY